VVEEKQVQIEVLVQEKAVQEQQGPLVQMVEHEEMQKLVLLEEAEEEVQKLM
jgi:hypothetical protein